ncbi:MAG: response regulator [Calothrix sp. MO_192.B10]|nr:response regulator [Calothrix sp. MO_192.B10]
MTMDPSIREQGYIYFMSEAPDLLHTIEEELFNLAEERTTATVHNLMRATHTIKGGAANVELEVIQQIAHSLEDVFKALYNPDVVIDAELQTLLFNSYECLHLALTSELNKSSYNSEELLNRTSVVFEKLQAKLGDAFGAEAYIPTSEELGFDIVLSIFETGVTQSIESISETINNHPPIDELVDFLSSQAEVFIGLAESLNLPGFADIGKTMAAALEINSSEAFKIAEVTLADLEQAKAAVIGGDRTQGGEPSLALKQLANQQIDTESQIDLSPIDNLSIEAIKNQLIKPELELVTASNSTEEITENLSTESELKLANTVNNVEQITENLSIESELKLANTANNENQLTEELSLASSYSNLLINEIKQLYSFFRNDYKVNNKQLKVKIAKFYIKIVCYILGWFNNVRLIPKEQLNLSLLVPEYGVENTLDYIDNWLNDFFLFLQEPEDSQSLDICRQGVILTILSAVIQFLYSTKDEIDLISVIQQRISELATEYRKHTPINEAEKDWYKRDKLKQLLVLKEISVTTTPDISTDTLVESIWGETDASIYGEDPVIETQLETTLERDDSVNIKRPESLAQDSLNTDTYLFDEEQVTETQIETTVEKNESANIEKPESLTIKETLKADTHTPNIIQEELVTNTPVTKTEVVDNENQNAIQTVEDKEQILPTTNIRQRSFVKVDVEGLQHLNYLAGELLIYHKRRSLEEEQLQLIIERLSQQLSRHQTTLNQLRDLPLQIQNFADQKMQQLSSVNFDSLEMDEYTEFHLALHGANEETLQLQETVESLDLLFRQFHQVQEKNQRLVLGILENVDNARMSPLGNIFNRFPQMLQKLGTVYGKRVQLKLSGTEVLVDKAIAEKLYDPLVHLIRNAFDHGIEVPEVRRQHNKLEQGTIEIRAYHQGSQTIIEIQDDGKGLNLEKIHTKAIEFGLIPVNHTPTSEELLDLLFSPGFSTAGKVSEISGRGMGLDIVRSHLQGLEGSISVNSLPNQGTTFILKIPFSMTTDKLMIVQAGGAVYALLLDSIEKIVLPSAEQIKYVDGKKVLYWNTEQDERMLGIRPLSDLMFYSGSFVSGANANHSLTKKTGEMKNPILVLRKNRERLALEVDQIIGEQELVIRPLGSAIAPPKYVYGCSSLANGNLILVIDGTLLLEYRELQSASIDVRALPGTSGLELSASGSENLTALPSVSSQDTDKVEPSKSTNINSKAPKVILVVDDAISLRQTLSLTLQKHGYQVIQSENGTDALEKLQLHPEVKVVISDLEMPNMNGFQLLSNLRQDSDSAKLPVIILTSRSAEKHRKLAQALGATAYFSKPYLEDELIATVKELENQSANNSRQLVLNH